MLGSPQEAEGSSHNGLDPSPRIKQEVESSSDDGFDASPGIPQGGDGFRDNAVDPALPQEDFHFDDFNFDDFMGDYGPPLL
jgi:hypothetical protein